jgi:hypothetical protein
MANCSVPDDITLRLQHSLSDSGKRYILKACWGEDLSEDGFTKTNGAYQAYFDNDETVCQNCSTDDIGRLAHEQFLQSFQFVTTETYRSCEAELMGLARKFNIAFVQPQDCKDFVRRWVVQTGKALLLLLLDLSEWTGNDKLKAYLTTSHFTPSTQHDSYRISVSLNMRNLCRVGGLKVRWTSLLEL